MTPCGFAGSILMISCPHFGQSARTRYSVFMSNPILALSQNLHTAITSRIAQRAENVNPRPRILAGAWR